MLPQKWVCPSRSLFSFFRGHTWARWVVVVLAMLSGLPVLGSEISLLAVLALFAFVVAAGYLLCAGVLGASAEAKQLLARRGRITSPAA